MTSLTNIRTILVREYLARTRTRAFWLSTVLVPLIIAGFTVLPTMLSSKQKGNLVLGLQDTTGRIGASLQERLTTKNDGRLAKRIRIDPIPAGTPNDVMAQMVRDRVIDAYIVVDDDVIRTGEVLYRARVTTNVMMQSNLEDVLSDVFAADRLQARGFDAAVVRELSAPVSLRPVDIAGAGNETTSETQFGLAYIMFFLLYTMQIFYGQNVMRGVLEEKMSRIVEVVVSSIKPIELMMGKLLGIGAVALTQVLVWIASAALFGSPALAMISSDAAMPHFSANLIGHFVFYFLCGFFLYATLYAAIGAMNNNEQEAQQMAMFAVLPIMIPAFFVFPVINDPNSTTAVGLSLFPFFTPLVMTARLAVGAARPIELAIADVLLVATILLVVVVAARIYRVGILMYGKRPTIPEIIRWARYR